MADALVYLRLRAYALSVPIVKNTGYIRQRPKFGMAVYSGQRMVPCQGIKYNWIGYQERTSDHSLSIKAFLSNDEIGGSFYCDEASEGLPDRRCIDAPTPTQGAPVTNRLRNGNRLIYQAVKIFTIIDVDQEILIWPPFIWEQDAGDYIPARGGQALRPDQLYQPLRKHFCIVTSPK